MCLVPTCDTCSAVGIDGTPESGHIASSSYSVSQSSTQIRTHTTAHEHYYLHSLALGELTYICLSFCSSLGQLSGFAVYTAQIALEETKKKPRAPSILHPPRAYAQQVGGGRGGTHACRNHRLWWFSVDSVAQFAGFSHISIYCGGDDCDCVWATCAKCHAYIHIPHPYI